MTARTAAVGRWEAKRWRLEAARPMPGRAGWGWLEVVGRVVGERQGVSDEVPPDGGRGSEAQRWPSWPERLPSALATLGQRQFPLAPAALGATAEDGGATAPVGASGPRGGGGLGWRRLPSAPAAVGAIAGGIGQQRSTVNPMKWKPILSVRVWLASSS
uniref:DUF834 domain-containing protein n=1 Tax=Oryza meridionalis TaxID=40149 RepID=A0A0E0E6R5_9ORYZ